MQDLLEEMVAYQKPVHELLSDVAVEVQNVVNVHRQCRHFPTKCVQHVSKMCSGR